MDTFIVYMIFLKLKLKISISITKKAKITLFSIKKVTFLVKYLDFANVLSNKLAAVLLE